MEMTERSKGPKVECDFEGPYNGGWRPCFELRLGARLRCSKTSKPFYVMIDGQAVNLLGGRPFPIH